MSFGNEAWTEGIAPGSANCFVSFGNRSGQLIFRQDAYRCVHLTDVFACLLNLPENGNCLLPDHSHSLTNPGLLISLDHCSEFWLSPHPLLKCSHSEMECETDYDRARKLSPPGKDEADETGVCRLNSLSPRGWRRVWTKGVLFWALCPTVTWFQPHVTMCPVRFKVPLWSSQSLGVALGFQFGDRWPGLKSWLRHIHHIWHHMWSLWVSACFPVKGDDNGSCGVYNGLLRRIQRSVNIKCDR